MTTRAIRLNILGRIRRYPRLYLQFILTTVLVVLCFATLQHLVVLDIPLSDLQLPYLAVPTIVGTVFGLLIATIRTFILERDEYLARIQARERELRVEIEEREKTAYREQRLQNALIGANDGMWDWNIETGEVYYSPRWCEMLGYRQEEMPPTYAFWEENLHPEDRPQVLSMLQQHLQGETGNFKSEFRLRSVDGNWVWVMARGKIVEYREDGRALRAVGTLTDISERKRAALAIDSLFAGTATAVGEDFFPSLVQNMARALEMRFAIIGLLESPQGAVLEPLAVWPRGVLETNDCGRRGTPCERPLQGESTIIVDQLQKHYPQDALSRRLNGRAYFGEPIFSRSGEIMGVLAAIDDKPLSEWKTQLARQVLPIFVARAAAEIERNLSERELARERDRAQTTLASIGDGVITTDNEGVVEYINPVACELTGWSVAEAMGKNFVDVFVLEDETGDQVAMVMQQCLKDNRQAELQSALMLVTQDGRKVMVEINASPIRARNAGVQGMVIVVRDVTRAHELAQQLTWQAAHDALTGLRNRKEFERELREVLAGAADQQTDALLYLDLDQFKVVNDTSGHSAGDELLRQLTTILSRQIRQSDVLARLGGDEFGLILRGCDGTRACEIAEKLTHAVKEFRFSWKDKIFEIGVSIGIVMLDAHITSSASALSAADIACYAAKDLGRNRYHMYHEDDVELARRHGEMQWVSRIQNALTENRFILFAQKIIRAEDGATVQHELLVRMLDENGEIIPTGSFIPAAERFGIMPEIDRWVIRRAFRCLSVEAPSFEQVSINLSGLSLTDHRLIEFILAQAKEHDIRPERVCFEITETAAIANLSHAIKFIGELRGAGFVFSLDDFGSGLSSFGYLKQLPVSYLKIDGSFVRDMCDDPIDRAMVNAINEVGHTMGIQTIAECVENAESLAALKGIGVDLVQGYHIHKPELIDG
ncbi:MAG TPA: EAL domain-containing protein [Thiohalobacter sp.]|nr:EAL domain-containing protein [Thiohalobacter sp.]